MKKLIVLGSAALLVSCGQPKVKLSGRFAGNDKVSVYLEMVTPAAKRVVDTVVTDAMGNFKFDISLADQQPTQFNLKVKDEFVPLMLSPGEKVYVSSVGGISKTYTVEGSPESELIRRLNSILVQGTLSLDSIANLYSAAENGSEQQKELTARYAKEYAAIKREQIRFITENAGSLAAVYALYQRLPGDETLFNGNTDFVYYRMVCDSTLVTHPTSPYVLALKKSLDEAQANADMVRMLNQELASAEQRGYPDITLPDMYGKMQSLSQLGEGKVVLLDFWSLSSERATVYNAELKDLYAKFAGKGFEIYQVSVDTSRPAWVTAVQNQKLPWISVCDFKGGASPAVRTYNVASVPANFLIDRNGNLAGKDLAGSQLESKLGALLK